ncbi:MAG: hypothetical protein FGM43_01390 [Sinobacteraceae bacterium]|nr:hypothetical protein [Nevskiaceae bacterium]
MSRLVDIFCPSWSNARKVDAQVLRATLQEAFPGTLTCRVLFVPESLYRDSDRHTAALTTVDTPGDVAIFLERVLDSKEVRRYKRRALIATPKWCDIQSIQRAEELVDLVLFKTVAAQKDLALTFSRQPQVWVGFSSPDPKRQVERHETFAHFGARSTNRGSQALLDLWRRRADLPALHVQWHDPAAPLNFPKWLQRDNVQLMLHHFPKHDDYFAELARHGIQLSFAPPESFCHYHNEGRAMGAVVLAVRSESFSAAELEHGINEIRLMSAKQRSESGRAARQAYEDDHKAFSQRLREAVLQHLLI